MLYSTSVTFPVYINTRYPDSYRGAWSRFKGNWWWKSGSFRNASTQPIFTGGSSRNNTVNCAFYTYSQSNIKSIIFSYTTCPELKFLDLICYFNVLPAIMWTICTFFLFFLRVHAAYFFPDDYSGEQAKYESWHLAWCSKPGKVLHISSKESPHSDVS